MSKKRKKEYKSCLNCDRQNFSYRRGYCTKCYPLILKIEKINKGTLLPGVLETIKKSGLVSLEDSKREYVKQLEFRLETIKEANSWKIVSAHDLESHINYTLRILGKKSLGKFNDPIAYYLSDDSARTYVYQLFSKIQLLKPFKVDYYQIYEAGSKNKK